MQVAERLQSLIRERRLKPGDKLPPERELQTLYGTGRSAIREALLLLERSGLITLRSGSPATVKRVDARSLFNDMRMTMEHFTADPQGIREIQHTRRILECGLIRIAAREGTDALRRRLREVLDRTRLVLDDPDACEELGREFHASIVKFAGSRMLVALHQTIGEWMHQQFIVIHAHPGRTDIDLAGHEAVYEALASGDPDEAERVMREHLEEVERAYWAVCNELERRKERLLRLHA